VLDTSSIFALTDQEDGADEVERLLDAVKQRECGLEVCAMSLMELYYTFSRGTPTSTFLYPAVLRTTERLPTPRAAWLAVCPACRTQAAGRLTHRPCLGLGDRQPPSARRSETLPRWV
jgi:hypothetical protein